MLYKFFGQLPNSCVRAVCQELNLNADVKDDVSMRASIVMHFSQASLTVTHSKYTSIQDSRSCLQQNVHAR